MLKILRKKGLVKIIFWSIIGVMVVAFVIWGTGAYRQSSQEKEFSGEIFGKKISSRQFFKLYNYYINQIRLSFGDKYQDILPYLNLKEQTWTQLILAEQAKKLGLKASNQEVIQDIIERPMFQKDGAFTQDTYKRFVRYFYNSSPHEFEELVRSEVTVKKLFDQLTKNITVSEEEILNDYKQENETVSIEYLLATAKNFVAQIQVTDEELKNYYQKNSEKFKKQPSVNIEYLKLPYPEKAQEFDKLRCFEQLKAIAQQMKSVSSLKELAKDKIEYKESGLFSMDEPLAGIFSDEFYRYAFSLKEKEASPVIQATEAVYVIKVLQKKDAYIPALAEIQDKVNEGLKDERAKGLAQKKMEEYKAKIEESLKTQPALGFKDVAKLLSLEVKTTKDFKRSEAIPDIGNEKKISDAAFALKPNQISAVIEANTGYYLIAQEKFNQINQQKYTQEKETYRKKLLEKKKQASFNPQAQEIIKKANLKEYSS